MFTPEFLAAAYPYASPAIVSLYYQNLVDTCIQFDITSDMRVAAFLANVGIESAQLRVIQENLNYSQKGLRGTFPKYFTTDEQATLYARQPEKIANKVYANRMENGPEASGDGWKYRGRGLIQVTGKQNYGDCGGDLSLDLIGQPDTLLDPKYATMSAGWFWGVKTLNKVADTGNFKEVCYGVNGRRKGDPIEYPERLELYNTVLKLLGS